MDRSEIENPRMAKFYDYWLEVRGSRPMPARVDINPADFSYALGNVFMVDIERDNSQPRFRFRLAGTLMVEVHKEELGGKWLDETFNDFYPGSPINGHYFSVAETGQPAYYLGKPSIPLKHQQRIERLLLPLSETGTDVTMMLAMIVYYDDKGLESYL